MNDIAAEVRDIIVLHLGVAEAQITDDASFKDTLGADSLDLVEIVMTCEERFDIEIPTKVASTFVTVGDAVGHIRTRLAEPAIRSERAPARRPHFSFGQSNFR